MDNTLFEFFITILHHVYDSKIFLYYKSAIPGKKYFSAFNI